MNARPRPTRVRKIHISVAVSHRIVLYADLQSRIALDDQRDDGNRELRKSCKCCKNFIRSDFGDRRSGVKACDAVKAGYFGRSGARGSAVDAARLAGLG